MSPQRVSWVARVLLVVAVVGAVPVTTATYAAAEVPVTEATGASHDATTEASHATIVAVLPNPTADGDAGERLVVEFPSPTNVSGWTIDDGESAARLPNATYEGRVVVTTAPDAVPPPPDDLPVVPLEGRLALANAGETITLRSPDGTVTTVTYEDAPEGELYSKTDDGWQWRVPGATDLPVVTDRDVPATLFVLPDRPAIPLDVVESADRRLLLAAYTFASPRIADALCAASDRGVDVGVLVEGEPVGGVTTRQVAALDRLDDCGVPVAVLGGPGDRYAVHHAKYAVVDERALVLSENWKPAGTGGRSSRGWGVVLESARVADGLARTFRADAGFRDARPWTDVRDDVDATEEPAANGTFPARFEPRTVEVDRVDVLVTPDNAEAGLVGAIDDADHSIAVQQVAIGGPDGPFANATLRAARRGVPVQVLLSGAWYVAEDNRRLVEELDGLARRESVPVSARLVRPRSRFRKTHVKGLLADGEVAAVGSLNWNAHAARENREVVVLLHDREAAAYYGRVFEADWRGGRWRLPLGFGVVALGLSLSASILVARTVRFDERRDSSVGYRPGKPPPPAD